MFKATKQAIKKRMCVANIAIFLCFGWFLFQTGYFAMNIAQEISPDEHQHYNMAKTMVEHNMVFFEDINYTYTWGQLSRNTTFYHFVTSLVLRLSPFPLDHFSSVVWARFFNVILSFVGLLYSYLLVRSLTGNKWVQLAALSIQTNLLMYVFLSGTVNYDNMVNMLAFAAFYYFVKFIQSNHVSQFLFALLATLIGCYTKLTFLPLALFFTMGSFLMYKQIISSLNTLKVEGVDKKILALFAGTTLFFILNVSLYGVNLVRYQAVIPGCLAVLGQDICEVRTSEYRRDQALNVSSAESERLKFSKYFSSYLKGVEWSIMGISAHKEIAQPRPDKAFKPTRILLLLFLISLIFHFRQLFLRKELLFLLSTVFFYMTVVMLNNYSTYMRLGVYGVALQGRYNFPVLAAALSVISFFLMFRIPDKLKPFVALAIFVLMCRLGFYLFIRSGPPPGWLV